MTTNEGKLVLKDCKALVTGAAKRIGQALAITLAKEGCDVIVHYNKSKEDAEKTVATIHALGREAVAVGVDLSLPDAPEQLAVQTIQAFGNLDILINNASIWPNEVKGTQGLLTETLDDWNLALSINAQAPFFLIKHLSKTLRQSSRANIINILDSSVSSPFLSRASHSVSKAALAAITTLAAKTLFPPIRVNALELGMVLKSDDMPEEEAKKIRWTPLERVVDSLLLVLKTEGVNGSVLKVAELPVIAHGELLR